MLFKIAFRNILRNGRRSVMTAAAIAIGAVALTLFGEYRGMAVIGLETGIVQSSGHLSVFAKGYSDFGSGRPGVFSISGYQKVIALIENDGELKPLLNVVTPAVSLAGIAGNSALDRSKTFFGFGSVPSARDKMRRWDEYRLYTTQHYAAYPLSDAQIDHGVAGKGLARILGLCPPPRSDDCPLDRPSRVELMSGSSGAPNIAVFYVTEAQNQGGRELDDNYVGMHLRLAQRLLFGSDDKVTSIVIQLNRSEDMARVEARLQRLFAQHKLDLEVRDYRELSATYSQILTALLTLFAFVSLVLGIVVLFTIANTMSMSVMERINEVGTARAMGVRRSTIRRQFLLEGAILGIIGATAGVVIAVALTSIINHAGITYHMPVSVKPIPLYLMDEGVGALRGGIWLALVIVAVAASFIPASRAARMKVVDALRHV